MESFLSKKIGVWVLLLLMVFVLVGMVGFGMLVRNRAQGNDRFGMAGEIAYNIASIPVTLRDLADGGDPMIARVHSGELRHADRSGWKTASSDLRAGIDGYLLLSRYDSEVRQHVVELVNLEDLEIVHEWRPDSAALFEGLPLGKEYENQPFDSSKFRAIHPYFLGDGGLIIKDMYGPMVRIDACGAMVWSKEGTYHHSTETGLDGTFWVPSNRDPGELENVSSDYFNDALSQFNEAGEELFSKSLSAILIENDREFVLTGMNAGFHDDPLHLNDIEPVLEDGTFWKRGDLFLSIRHKSAIILYRPSTNRIIWMKFGPWSFQHDVDIIDDGKIAIFDNKMYSRPQGPVVDISNDIAIYDFATDSVSYPYTNGMRSNDIRTVSEGLYTILPGGNLMIEEADYGRILFLSLNGELAMDYVNGGVDGNPYKLGWVRWVSREVGDRAVEEIGRASCADE